MTIVDSPVMGGAEVVQPLVDNWLIVRCRKYARTHTDTIRTYWLPNQIDTLFNIKATQMLSPSTHAQA